MQEPIIVTDYDVLAEQKPGRRYVLDEFKRHIGNTRFSVLVDMYREAYEMVQIRGNEQECDKIVDRIVGVTCHRDVAIAVNKGRFLVKKQGESDWVHLDDDESKELVRQVLTAPLPIAEEPLEGDIVTSTAFSALNLGWVDLPPPPIPSTTTDNATNDKKRGRRLSLLRRSASESTMMDDKKKLHNRGLGMGSMGLGDSAGLALESIGVGIDNVEGDQDDELSSTGLGRFYTVSSTAERSSISSLTRQVSAPVIMRSSEQIKEWQGMDVVLSASGRMLSSKEIVIGNNRLTVLLSLQKQRYWSLSPEEREKVAADLVKVVCQYWGGRVLIDQGFAYAKLGDDQATLAMKNLLDPEHAQTIIVSTSIPSKPLLSAPPVPAFLREASMEILSSNGVHTGDQHTMQNQAVKSLQARKAKRTMTKSLGRGQQPLPKQNEEE